MQPVASGKGWFCTVCKARTRHKGNLATSKCSKVAAKAWVGATSCEEPKKPRDLRAVVDKGLGNRAWGRKET